MHFSSLLKSHYALKESFYFTSVQSVLFVKFALKSLVMIFLAAGLHSAAALVKTIDGVSALSPFQVFCASSELLSIAKLYSALHCSVSNCSA